MKRIFLRLKQPLRNERGEITFFACFFVVGIVMLISFLLLYASIRITCINIRNGAKMELNNLTADLAVGDYILTSKISSVPVSSDVALNSIPSGKVAISLTVKTLASGLSDKLQPGDIIRIYHFLDTAAEVPELRFVKVLSVTDSDGINVDNAKEPTEDEEKQQSATITVLASPEQAKIITGLENDGVAHVALISRNNDKLADELLAEQDKTLQEIYFPETLIEEEAADAENSDAESEPQETVNAETAQSTNETAPSAE